MSTLFPIAKYASDLRPRPYQADAIEGAMNAFKDDIGALIRLPTGTGKTVTASWIIDEWLQQGEDYYALVLCHERQLVTQFREEVEDVLGIPVGLEMGSDGAVTFNSNPPKIIVASRATLYESQKPCDWCRGDGCNECDDGKISTSRLYKFDHKKNWLVVIDEAHRYKWSLKSCRHIFTWFEHNPKSKRLGLSATPKRGDGVSLSRLFPAVALDYPAYDLNGGPNALDDGWSVPFDQRFVTVEGLDWKNVKEVAGDFADEDLERILSEQETLRSLVIPMLDLVEQRRTLIFSPGVAMAKAVSRLINSLSGTDYDCGESESLDGSVPDDLRKQTYERFERGDIQFLSVCGLCREGYNNKGIQAVAVFRPTKSEALAEQMKGRGTRPLSGTVDGLDTAEERRESIANSDKPNCMIVDLVGISGLPPVASTAHLLATGKPDEVIELANQKAIDSDGSVDMIEMIQQAEEELEEEKRLRLQKESEEREKARLERLRREEMEREEAIKQAKLKADVRYNVSDSGSAIVRPKSPARIPFGKHKGNSVSDTPTWSLKWILPRVKQEWLKGAINKELRIRNEPAAAPNPASSKPIATSGANENQRRVLQKFGYDPNVTYDQAAQIIMTKINPQ